MPALESINSFSSGMHSDASKFFQKPDSYLEALNFRVTTDNGSTNHALVNIKGNEYKCTLNNTYPVYKIVPAVSTGSLPCDITISGTTSPIINVNPGTTGFDIYNVVSQMANFNIDFYAAYYQDSVIIWSETLNPNPTLSSTGLTFQTQYGLLNNWYVAPQTSLVPIGSTYIRDDIYVFTTPTSSNPSGPGTINSGQIFKLTYDRVLLTATLTLIYNNYVDFSTTYPIPPTATQGRYENDTIQRLYWSDNFNPLRSCNATDPNLMAFPVGLLNIFPIAEPFIPTLQTIQSGGSLDTGIYQFSYRLKKGNSQVTLWSPLSLPVPICNNMMESGYVNGGAPSPGWQGYVGLPPHYTTTKSITEIIAKLDDNYDFIDIVVCKRYSYGDPGTFEIFQTNQPIVSGQPIIFTYTGNETVTILTLNEFLLTSPGFTHCKTIETKDNRLFAGNVRVEQEELIYDARAYQFPTGSGTCSLTHNNIATNYNYLGQLDTPFFLPETNDTINSDYLRTDPNGILTPVPTNGQRFFPNSTIPGGAGPNISYQMGTYAVKIDDLPNEDFQTNKGATPWRHTNQIYNTWDGVPLNLGIEDENYPFNHINDSYKTAYKQFTLRSYQPNEIYRFGIQFYDKQGSPYYVKWIGDIRMPDYSDVGFNQPLGDSNDAINTTFGLTAPSNTNPNQKYYMKPIYINFTVDVSSIIDQISGFEIVRCERTPEDRVVAGTGVMYQVQYGATANLLSLPDSMNDTVWYADGSTPNSDSYLNVGFGVGAAAGRYRPVSYTLDCFDWQYEGFPAFDASYDRVCVKGALEKTIGGIQRGYTQTTFATYDDGYHYNKHYVWTDSGTITQDELSMSQATPTSQGGTIAASGGYSYYNATDDGNALRSVGMSTVYVEFNAGYNYQQYFGALGNPYKIYFEYRKYARLINQYGGRNYNARTQSEYISCGMYVPVNDVSLSPLTYDITFGVFGGDTFYTIWDSQKGDKYYPNKGAGNNIESYIHYKPNIGYHNSELRFGKHFESDEGGPVASIDWTESAGNGDIEDFLYDNMYSIENNIKKFYPKPLLINLTDSWDNRVYYSEVKINGEVQDSWENFKANNYWDVEGSYGPINSLIAFADKLYFIQKKAFGWLLVNLQSLTTTTSGATLSVGQGATIGRHDYVSTDIGTSHQWSVTRSPNSVLFVDGTNKKVYKYTKNGLVPISEVYEQRGTFVRLLHDDILINDNPILNSGILCAYDFYNDEYLITLLNKYTRTDDEGVPIVTQEYNTISFNEKIDRWNSFYSFTPNLYLFNRTQLWSNNPLSNSDLYLHNEGDYSTFYGTTYDSTVKLLVNDNAKYTKLFNNFLFNTEAIAEATDSSIYDDVNVFDSTFDSFRAYNDYQNTDYVTLDPNLATPNIRRVERQWNLQCPRNKVLYTTVSPNIFTNLGTKLYGERMRDKYLTVDLGYDNSNNYKLLVNFINTDIRPISR